MLVFNMRPNLQALIGACTGSCACRVQVWTSVVLDPVGSCSGSCSFCVEVWSSTWFGAIWIPSDPAQDPAPFAWKSGHWLFWILLDPAQDPLLLFGDLVIDLVRGHLDPAPDPASLAWKSGHWLFWILLDPAPFAWKSGHRLVSGPSGSCWILHKILRPLPGNLDIGRSGSCTGSCSSCLEI